MKIGIASDHRGYKLKQKLTKKLIKEGYTVIDYGTDSEIRTDYQVYAFKLGEAYNNNEFDYGVLICGSAVGISIAANKVKNIRCAKVNSMKEVIHAKECDFANIIALSGSFSSRFALKLTKRFVNLEHSSDPVYKNRVDEISKYENSHV